MTCRPADGASKVRFHVQEAIFGSIRGAGAL
jgi:hypothetical protein